MIPDTTLATQFNALSHPSRVAIFRYLLARGPEGQSFGFVADALAMSPSTLVHHLREMERAQLVTRDVQGRSTVLKLNLAHLVEILQEFTQLCCCATEKG